MRGDFLAALALAAVVGAGCDGSVRPVPPAERAHSVQRAPIGPVDLLAAENRTGWERFESAQVEWDGDAMIITGTGTGRGAYGFVLHRAYRWATFDLQITFEFERGGFQVVGRARLPHSGVAQAVRSRTFSPGRAWYLVLEFRDGALTVSGDVETMRSELSGNGNADGGIGLYIHPGSKVRILQLRATRR